MFDRLADSRRRRRAARRVPDGPLRRYLDLAPPDPRTALADLPLLAVDIETTGLDPRRDEVVSLGLLPVDGDRIVLGGARSMLLRPGPGANKSGVGQSATLHRITDDAVASGAPADEALDELFAALTGRVLLAHYARMETGFLAALCERTYGVRPPFTVVDTLTLHHRILRSTIDMGFTSDPAPGELRLWAARERYGLPRYRAHDALTDALACAELYQAQVHELGTRGVGTLRELG